MGVENKVYSFRFDEELIEKLRQEGEKQNRSLSNMVETILKQYLENIK